MTLVLKLAGHGNALVALDLLAVEVALEGTLRTLQDKNAGGRTVLLFHPRREIAVGSFQAPSSGTTLPC
jgi:hypothetical protein